MARLSERLAENAPGEFYVDRSCIDCDTCRRIAPEVFAEGESFSYVARQPEAGAGRRRALMALVACPTASIGTEPRTSAAPAVDLFPESIDDGVSLYRDIYLFTGDHLAWSPERGALYAFRDACWYSWKEQTRSMERLLDYRFEWVLPGHGWRHHAPTAAAMRSELERCVEWMRRDGAS